jgi:hypothetical protein
MKICILIIYSKNTKYEEMLEIQRNYLNSFKNEQVMFYFTQMNNEQITDIEELERSPHEGKPRSGRKRTVLV